MKALKYNKNGNLTNFADFTKSIIAETHKLYTN